MQKRLIFFHAEIYVPQKKCDIRILKQLVYRIEYYPNCNTFCFSCLYIAVAKNTIDMPEVVGELPETIKFELEVANPKLASKIRTIWHMVRVFQGKLWWELFPFFITWAVFSNLREKKSSHKRDKSKEKSVSFREFADTAKRLIFAFEVIVY